MFSTYTSTNNLKEKQSPVILNLCLRETWTRKSYHVIQMSSKSKVFKSLRIEECFRKVIFQGRICVGGRLSRRNVATSSNSFGYSWSQLFRLIVLTSPQPQTRFYFLSKTLFSAYIIVSAYKHNPTTPSFVIYLKKVTDFTGSKTWHGMVSREWGSPYMGYIQVCAAVKGIIFKVLDS